MIEEKKEKIRELINCLLREEVRYQGFNSMRPCDICQKCCNLIETTECELFHCAMSAEDAINRIFRHAVAVGCVDAVEIILSIKGAKECLDEDESLIFAANNGCKGCAIMELILKSSENSFKVQEHITKKIECKRTPLFLAVSQGKKI